MKTLEICRWMVALAKAGLAGSPEEGAVPAASPAEPDWRELYSLCYDQGLAPLAHAGIAACRLNAPGEVAAQFARYARGSQLRAAKALDQFGEIARSFAGEGIELIALKGLRFAFRHYPDPGLRRFKDMDILVRVADLDRAGAVLDRLGYVSLDAADADRPSAFLDNDYKYHSGYTRGDEYPVELHWDLVPRRSPVRFDLEGLWARSRESIEGARELAFADEAVFQAAHMTRHEFLFPVRAFFDLRLLLAANAGFDADSLWRSAGECGATVDLAAALAVAQELGLIEIPPALTQKVAQQVSSSRLDVADLARYVLTWPKFDYADRAIDLFSASGPASTLRRLGELVFPKYTSLVEREEKVEECAPTDLAGKGYGALWGSRFAYWARKARNLPAETANLRTSIHMRRAFNNRTVREDD